MKKEVKILGAGISGLVCGITLARAGYKVTIYEKNKNCGKRFNNDFQGIENWSTKKDIVDILKEIGIKINFLCKPQYTVKMYDKKLKCATVRTGNPIFYLVKRGTDKQSLDTGLKKQAIKAGVKIKFNKTINKEKCDVIATGPTCADAIAKGITFETSLPNMNVIILNDELAPKGYVYFFINNKKGILAICIFRHFNKEKEYFDKALNQIKKMYDCDFRNIKEFGGYGNFFIEKNYKNKGALYIGEAAGLQDFLFGFGMRYAMISGYVAARSIITKNDYNILEKEIFADEINNSITNRFLYELFGNGGYKFLISKVNHQDKTKNAYFLLKLYTLSFLSKLILPIAKYFFKSKTNLHKDCSCIWCRSRAQEVN